MKTKKEAIKIIGNLRLWPRQVAARELGVCEKTLQRWEVRRAGPPIVFIGHRPHYEEASLMRWIMRSAEAQPATASTSALEQRSLDQLEATG